MESETTSFLARQPSGIRALPSHDDDEIDDIYDEFEYNLDYETNDNSIEEVAKVNENNMDFDYDSISSGSNDNNHDNDNDNDSNSSISSSFSSGNNGELVNGEDFEDSVIDPHEETLGKLVGSSQDDVFGTKSMMGSSQNDVFETGSMLGSSPKIGVPVAKVSGEFDDYEIEVGSSEEEEGFQVERVVPRVRVLGGDGNEENEEEEVELGEPLEEKGVESLEVSNKGSEVKSVGDVVEEGEVIEADSNEDDFVKNSANVDVVELGTAVVEDKDERTIMEVEVGKSSKVTEVAGVIYSDEGDAIVDSINVDASEAARSGVAVIREAKEVVGSGEVNFVEAIRSGVAVAGETEFEDTELETKGVEAPLVENMTLGNEFAPLAHSNLSKVYVESSDMPYDELEKAQTNDTEKHQSVDISETLNTENNNSESDFITKEIEPAGELKFSGGETEKVLPVNVDDEPNISSVSVEGEKGSNRSFASALVDGFNITDSDKNQIEQTKVPSPETLVEVQDDEGSSTDGEGDHMYFGNGNSSRKVIEELKTHENSGMIDGQVVTDSDEEGDSNEEGEGNELFDSAALAALLRAATSGGADPGTITVRSQDGSRLFSMERPVGLEPSVRSARPSVGPNNSSFFNPSNLAPAVGENLSEEDKRKLEILQQLKVKFLRLVQRVGFTAEHSLAAQVLYKLNVFAGRPVTTAFTLDNAKQTVMQLEAEGKDNLDFSLNILVLGKTGVGKSAIINSMFGEEKVKINAFEPETTSVNEVCGTVDGVTIRFIDAPGLKSSASEQGFNRKILASVKKVTKKYPPDIVFYVDRLDSQTKDRNELPLLKTISNSLGSSIWRNAIITLTHASSAPQDGPSGTPLSYEVFVARQGYIVQQSIAIAVGEMQFMNPNMMTPVSLVENHHECQTNRDGHKILPNGQAWRAQLLLLCFSVKVLCEASATSKPQDAFDPRKLFGFRTRSAPFSYLLSSLLQPRAHPKLSADQGGDSVDSDVDLDDVSDSDQEEEDEYDQLPPFKPLKKSQMAKLSSYQKKAYFEEYDYRVKLLQRKQWREELKRIKETKKNGKNGIDFNGEMPEEYDGENGTQAAVPVPLPDMTLPPSFDSDNPAYRYRFLEPSTQFLARPVLDPHGWDHDCGYEGVNVEHNMGIADRFPASFSVQVNKDKKDFNIHMDSAVSAKHGENGSSLLGFDVETIGKQYAYTVRGESRFKKKKNKTAAGVTVTFLGENVATGVKVEDQIILGKRLVLVGSTGTVRSQKDAAYGAIMEVRLREADYPIGKEQSSFTLSLMKRWGDLAVGANLQSQISVGRNSKMAVRAALNNKMSGQITVRTSSSDHLSLALAGLLPIAVAIYQKLRPGDISENNTIY